jgi:hypothetical protein
MAKINFNSFSNDNQNQNRNDGDYSVKFFSIQDGESAIVRIMIDSTEDFDIHSVHKVKMPGFEYGRNVNCINDTHNPATCPLCAAGAKIDQRIFIRMLQYKVVNNQVEITPVVWERSVFDKVFGAQKLVNYITDYGALSDMICKITRNGTGLNTTYTPTFALNMMPNTKNVYRDDIYVKKTDAFGDFNVLRVSVLDKNFDELTQFVATGSFPERVKTNDAPAAPVPNIPNIPTAPATETFVAASGYATSNQPTTIQTETSVADNYVQTANAAAIPANRTYTPTTPANNGAAPWDNNGGFNRPRRY